MIIFRNAKLEVRKESALKVFEAVGVIVVTLVFYAIASLIVAGIITPTNGNDDKPFWIIAWVIGDIIFAVVVYFWIIGIKLPI